MHRAFSWLQRVEELKGDAHLDAELIFRWIALNSLYGQWDSASHRPQDDLECLGAFLKHVREVDAGKRIPQVLEEHKKLALAVINDAYLTKVFWADPSHDRALKTQPVKIKAQGWYLERQYAIILDELMRRIYFHRCQLVHGGATSGSQHNRTAVRRCSTMLGHLVTATLIVLIDHGWDEDWGVMCYPPVD
jgi:hypothetical protein